MKSKSKCPVCNNNLHKINVVVSTCTNDKCKLWGLPTLNLVLEALAQAKQDLAIVLKTLKKADTWFGDNQCLDPAKWIRRTVKKIEHKE